MEKGKEKDSFVNSNLVYIVVCYGQVISVHSKLEDAVQTQQGFIMKNRPADLIVKPLV